MRADELPVQFRREIEALLGAQAYQKENSGVTE